LIGNLIPIHLPSSFSTSSFFLYVHFCEQTPVPTKLPKILILFTIQNGRILKWPDLSQKFSMNLVLYIILKLLSRPGVYANFQGLEANTFSRLAESVKETVHTHVRLSLAVESRAPSLDDTSDGRHHGRHGGCMGGCDGVHAAWCVCVCTRRVHTTRVHTHPVSKQQCS
jgi:hypothetical protein